MLKEFVGFVFCSLAIVARDRNVKVVRKLITAQRIDIVQELSGNLSGVGTFALGDRDRHRRILRLQFCSTASIRKQNVSIWFRRAVLDFLSYVTQIDWTPGVNSHHDVMQIFESGKESSGLDLELAIVPCETPGLPAAVHVLELCHNRSR